MRPRPAPWTGALDGRIKHHGEGAGHNTERGSGSREHAKRVQRYHTGAVETPSTTTRLTGGRELVDVLVMMVGPSEQHSGLELKLWAQNPECGSRKKVDPIS
jgi:hypothetical protein